MDYESPVVGTLGSELVGEQLDPNMPIEAASVWFLVETWAVAAALVLALLVVIDIS